MGTMMAAMLVMVVGGFGVQPLPPQDAPLQQQQQAQRGRGPGLQVPGPGAPIQELQEMFEAFVLVQAQRILQLSDEEYARFFPRMKRLQDVRRQHTRQRIRLLNELRRLYGPERADDQVLTERVRVLDELDSRFDQELRTAKAAVDDTLTVRQRAAFRFFEQEMEVQKVDYLTRARQPRRQ